MAKVIFGEYFLKLNVQFWFSSTCFQLFFVGFSPEFVYIL